MLKFAALIVNKGVAVSQIGQVFLSIIPTFLEIAIPMSALLGVMMAFARMSGDSEIVVMRASGISIYQLVRPVIIFGLFVTALSFYVSMELKPWGFTNLSRVFFEIARAKSTSGLTEGVFNTLGNITLYAEKIDDREGELTHVIIDDRRDKSSRRVIVSRSGKIVSDATNHTITLELFNGESHEIVEKRYITTHFINNNLTMQSNELFGSDDTNKDPSPRQLRLNELRAEIIKTEGLLAELSLQPPPSPEASPPSNSIANQISQTSSKQPLAKIAKRLRRLRTELGSRFSMPIASFILALIALPLGIMPPRTQKTWGAGLSLSIGLTVFVVYYGFLSVGLTLGEIGKINSLMALWIPNAVCLVITIFFIQRVASEKWNSVADAFSNVIPRILSFVRNLQVRKKAA